MPTGPFQNRVFDFDIISLYLAMVAGPISTYFFALKGWYFLFPMSAYLGIIIFVFGFLEEDAEPSYKDVIFCLLHIPFILFFICWGLSTIIDHPYSDLFKKFIAILGSKESVRYTRDFFILAVLGCSGITFWRFDKQVEKERAKLIEEKGASHGKQEKERQG